MYPGTQTSAGNGGLGQTMQYQGVPTNAAPRDTAQQTLDEQDKLLAQLYQAISELENRLGVVLSPLQPNPSTTEVPTPTSANLIERTRQHNRALNSASNRIVALMERLQL